ncbi:UNVERIFIED_CONTAM: hypothetical protein FKN15_014657 [Acipenser sinensis]
MDKVDAYMERWHAHQRELKEGGATWCLACLEYGHLPEVCPYEDPLFVQAFDRGEVETAEEWIHLKAIPSPQVDQETCLTCLKGEEWCFAVGKVGHKPPDQPPPWQEVELLVPKKGRRGGAKKAKKQAPAPEREPRWCTMCIAYGHEDEDCPEQEPEDEEPERRAPEWEQPERRAPEWEQPERPAPEWEQPERPAPEWEEPERPKPKREESVRPQPKRKESVCPQPKREESVRPQPKREESVHPQPKREELVRPQPKEGGVCASKALGPKLPLPPECLLGPCLNRSEGEFLLVPPQPPWEDCLPLPAPPAEGECLLVPSPPPPAEGEYLLVPHPPSWEGLLLPCSASPRAACCSASHGAACCSASPRDPPATGNEGEVELPLLPPWPGAPLRSSPPEGPLLLPLPPEGPLLLPLPPEGPLLLPLPPEGPLLLPLPPEGPLLLPLPPEGPLLLPLPPEGPLLLPLPPEGPLLLPLPPEGPLLLLLPSPPEGPLLLLLLPSPPEDQLLLPSPPEGPLLLPLPAEGLQLLPSPPEGPVLPGVATSPAMRQEILWLEPHEGELPAMEKGGGRSEDQLPQPHFRCRKYCGWSPMKGSCQP